VNARTKFLVGALLVGGSATYLMATSIQATGMYYLFPSELAAKVAADPTFRDVGVKMGARVVPGTIVRTAGGREVRFDATDGEVTYPIVHRGTIPDTFTDSSDVVVEGRLDPAGTFQSKVLLAKCGARFEAAPPRYRDAPGYTKKADS
jgi:cytochrome c-type biogenesis protein CcmE